MQVILKDLLSCTFFSNSKLLAGEQGFLNKVTSVTVLDSPDAPKYLKGGELVVTTAYSLLNNPLIQKQVIENLKKNGAAALGIKLRFFNHVLPEVMCKQANKLGFPIISIADEHAYVDIYEFISSSLMSRQTREIKKTEEVFKEINTCIHNEGLYGVAKTLHKWTGFQALLMFDNRLYAYPVQGPFESALLDKSKWRKKTSPFEMSSEVGYFCQAKEDIQMEWLAMEISNNGQPEGMILLVNEEGSFDKDDYLLIDYAASACTMEVKKIKSLVNMQRKYRKQFLEAFFKGRYSWEESIRQAQQLDFHIHQIGMVLILSFGCKSRGDLQELYMRDMEYMVMKTFGEKTVFGIFEDNSSVIFISNEQMVQVESFFYDLKKRLKVTDLVFGLGRLVSFKDISKSYREAKIAIKIGESLKINPQIFYFNKLGFYRLLRVDDEIERYYEDYLKPIIHENGETGLLDTLTCFIESGYNYRDTAVKMFFHPNTVRYRISKVEQLCGVSFKYANDRLNMEIALKILPLVEAKYK